MMKESKNENDVFYYLGIVGSIAGILSALIEIIAWLDSGGTYRLLATILFAAMSIWILLLLSKRKTEKKEYIKEIYNLVRHMHLDLAHNIRDGVARIEKIELRILSGLNNNMALFAEIYENEKDKAYNTMRDLMRYLSDYLSSTRFNNGDVYACIKIISQNAEDEYEKMSVVTFVRSPNTPKSRLNKDKPVVVGKCSDYMDFCYEGKSDFKSSNLQKLEKIGLYENDSDNYKAGEYSSTILTPIRHIQKERKNGEIFANYEVLGFVCIDSKENNEHWENEDSIELQMLSMISDSLYIYFREFIYTLGEVA